jgi:hypothetical protein
LLISNYPYGEQLPPEQEIIPPTRINNCVEALGGPAAASIDNTTEEAVNPTPTSTDGVPERVTNSAAKPQEEAEKEQTTELPLVPSVGEAISAWWNLSKEVTQTTCKLTLFQLQQPLEVLCKKPLQFKYSEYSQNDRSTRL